LLLQRLWRPTIEQAFARRDVEALVKNWADDAIMEVGGTHGLSGTFTGKEAIRHWYEQWAAQIGDAEIRITRVAVTNPLAVGLTNTVMYEATVDETSLSGVTVQVQFVGVNELRRGKVVHGRTYLADETPELLLWGTKPQGDEMPTATTG
jgi:ketosteroid isomerase-like protein